MQYLAFKAYSTILLAWSKIQPKHMLGWNMTLAAGFSAVKLESALKLILLFLSVVLTTLSVLQQARVVLKDWGSKKKTKRRHHETNETTRGTD